MTRNRDAKKEFERPTSTKIWSCILFAFFGCLQLWMMRLDTTPTQPGQLPWTYYGCMLFFLQILLAIVLPVRMRAPGVWWLAVLSMKLLIVMAHAIFHDEYKMDAKPPNFFLLCFAMMAFLDVVAVATVGDFDWVGEWEAV